MKKKMKLAILLMATALIGVSQDQGLLTTPVENNHVVLADTKSKSKTTKKDDKATKAAKKAVKQLEKDFFTGCDNLEEFIETLDNNEEFYANEYRKKGSYNITRREMVIHMLGINTIVRRGIKPNDNNYGLVIMKMSNRTCKV